MPRHLYHEIHRFYGDGQRNERRTMQRNGRRNVARHTGRRLRYIRTPLQLLVLVAIGAAVAQFLPALWCALMQFASVIAIGLVVYFCYRLFSKR